MDLEAKISSLRSYVKSSAQKDENGIKQNEKPDNSGTDAESNGWWSSISNKAQEPDPWLPGLVNKSLFCTFDNDYLFLYSRIKDVLFEYI